MAAADGPRWSSQPVQAAAGNQADVMERYAHQSSNVVESLSDVVSVLDGDPARLEGLKSAVGDLLEARRSSQLHARALQQLQQGYEAGPDSTDYAAQLETRVARLKAAEAYSLQGDFLFQEFLASTTDGADDAGGAGGRDERVDDGIDIVDGAAQLAPNATCPITTKQLLDIEEPVQDAVGVVGGRGAVLAFLATRRGRAKIVAGSSHEVTTAELVPAERVIKEKRRLAWAGRRGGAGAGGPTQHGGGGGQDVLEV